MDHGCKRNAGLGDPMTAGRERPVLPYATPCELAELQRIAEASLGRPVHDAQQFRDNCQQLGLGDALNLEHDLIP